LLAQISTLPQGEGWMSPPRSARRKNRYLNHPPLEGYGMHGSDSLFKINMLQSLGTGLFGGFGMAFGEVRVAERADWLVERVAATGSVVLHKLGEDRAGEIAIGRFLRSPYVSVDAIVEAKAVRTAEQCAGRHVVAMQDTTEFNFSRRSGKRVGFGPGGDGKTPGYFIHPVIVADIESEAVIGLADVAIWTRTEQDGVVRGNRQFEEKESERWLMGCKAAARVLGNAASVTMLADRESDIYPMFADRPDGLDLIIRAAQNRVLAGGERLFDALNQAAVLDRYEVRVAPRGPGDKGRVAKVELRAGIVRITCPKAYRKNGLLETIELNLVEAREVDPPKGKEAIHWRLLTTHEVGNGEQANRIVQLYRLRWRIEQTFRSLKSDGLALEDSQVTDPERMFNLAAIALAGAIVTMQLLDARDGSPRPSSDVIDDTLLPALERLSRKLEGSTQRQKNPHQSGTLPFIAWISARLGGWNCYYKPPGPKTMRAGWNQLAAILQGYALANP